MKESQLYESSNSCYHLARGNWTGMKNRKVVRKKMKSSREALSIMRGLTGGDCTRVYSHF